MRLFPVLALALAAAPCFAQTPLSPEDTQQITTRMLQLIESTAVAVPGLVHASEPLKQNAEITLGSIQKTPLDPALIYRFISQVKAYLALSDSMPHPYPFPPTADRQYGELREDLKRIEQHLEAILQAQNLGAQAREADPSDLKHYAEANAKMLPSGNVARVVFLGDSITEGWRLNEYFVGRDFVNRGIGGQTTIQMLGRFPDDVFALHPRAVVIQAGMNDILHGTSVGAIENDLAMMGDLAKAHGIRALFGSLLPVGANRNTPPAIQQLNAWMQDYSDREGHVYVDYYSRMIDASGHLQGDLSDDGLNPNAKGYRVMAPIALEAVGRAVAAEQNPPVEPPKRRFRMLSK